MAKPRQIIAMGGGGFTMEPDNPYLDDYVLKQSPQVNPKICFLPTASEDHWGYIGQYYDYFTVRHCIPTHLSLSRLPTEDLEDYLLDNDIIYVGGGHTGKMLEKWRQFELDHCLRIAHEEGVILAGVSSGASCWFDMAVTDSIPGQLSAEKCLGFLKGSHCAHYDNEGRQPSFHRLIRSGLIPAGIGTENFAALHFIEGQLEHVVGSVLGTAAYLVGMQDDELIEDKVISKWLGASSSEGDLS